MTAITVAQVAYELRDAAAASGFGITTIKEAVASGELVAHYGGKAATKPVIRAVDLDEWVASLPTTRRAS